MRGVVYSAIQNTGRLHVGNYLGALRQWVDLQASPDELVFGVADLHALTSDSRASSVETVRAMLAVGLDPQRCVLYRQSDLGGLHTELMWLLACVASKPQLERMTHYKDKTSRGKDTLGLFAYPVLQAADVLLFKADRVPVGDDQRQHLELARDVCLAFNARVGRQDS